MDKKKINIIWVKLKRRLSSLYFGVHKSEFKWSWFDLKNLRDYELWDDSRRVDWFATAKQNSIQIKEMEEDKELSVLFMIDSSVSMNFKSEDRTKLNTLKEVIKILYQSSLSSGLKIWAIINNKNKLINLEKSNKLSNLIKILNILGDKSTWKIEISKQLEFLIKLNIKNTLIIILTDKILPEEEIKKLKYLNIKNKVIFVNIFDYFENNLHIDWQYNFVNNKNNFFVNLFSSSKKAEYIEYRKEKILNFKGELKQNNIWYLFIDNKQNLFKTLFRYFASKNR